MKNKRLFLTSLLLLAVTALFVFTPVYAMQDGNGNGNDTETVTVTFNPNGGELRRGELVQVIPVGGNAAPPTLMLRFDGWIFSSWDKETTDITEDTEITAIWKRLFAVSSNGEGYVSSADTVWLARAVAQHKGFGLQNLRIGNVLGIDRLPTARDITDLLRWLVGYPLELLMKNSPDNMPTIEVLTEFPDGETLSGVVFFEYFAEPSIGAEIAYINYTVNGELGSTLWPSTLNEFGTARIPLRNGDNHIIVTVHDTAGMSADYVVPQVPHKIDLNFTVPEEHYHSPSITGTDGYKYSGDMLILQTIRPPHGMDRIAAGITPERVAEAVANIDGVIIGQYVETGSYTIQIPPQETVEDIDALGERMVEEYPDLFRTFYPSSRTGYTGFLGRSTPPPPTNDPWWSLGKGDSTAWWPFRDDGTPYEWGLSAVRLPEAWAASRLAQQGERSHIRLGIMDTNIFADHEDLGFSEELMANISSVQATITNIEHGTTVMGVLAALHDNELGLAGATNISREALYVYNSSRYESKGVIAEEPHSGTTESIRDGLWWLVTNGVKVINVSQGTKRNELYNRDTMLISDKMSELLALGYDFVIVQSAGQEGVEDDTLPIDSDYVVVFTHAHLVEAHEQPTRRELERRTITVGATTREGTVAPWSNYGVPVDILAPGKDIYTTDIYMNEGYGGYYDFLHGTSLATPIVAGIIHLMWEENPSINGNSIKQLLLGEQTTRRLGTRMTDNREIGSSFAGSIYQVDAYDALLNARNVPDWLETHTHARLVGQLVAAQTSVRRILPLPFAQITHYKYRSSTAPTITHTQSQGFYRFDDIEVSDTDKQQNWHTFRIQAEGFAPTDINMSITQKGVVTRLDTVRLVPVPEGMFSSSLFGGSIRVPALSGASDVSGASDEPAELTPYEGTLTLQIIDGLYYLDSEMLEDEEWLDFLDFDILDTIEVTDGNFYAEMPAGNYTVIVSG
ncbi:MAG: S8 family serine peptidase, partial [Defluviitaleaceae bacterium]|nr:S8 family serine peptidase [Defluviitaleaceae bacterium]